MKTICYLGLAAGDYGGGSRSLSLIFKNIDRTKYRPVAVFSKDGPLIRELRDRSIPCIVLEHREPDQRLPYLAAIARAVRFLSSNHVDLVHINYGAFWRPAELVAARILRIPFVPHYRLINRIRSPYLRHARLIIANSQFTATESESAGVPCVVMHNVVDLDRFDRARDVRAELGISPADVVVCFAGQVREEKGVASFIEMAHRLRRSGALFVIAGECRDREKHKTAYTVERLHAEIGGNERIRYIGYRADIENVYRSSDIVVVPSQWDEPFGLVNIEAGASFRPVVATRVGGIPEIITHGENGYLAERGDLDALTRYVSDLIDEPELRERVGQTARRMVEERFTDRPIRELEHLYATVLG